MNNIGPQMTFQPFGIEFQQQLLAEIITDQRFGSTIIEILKPSYFPDVSMFFIVKVILAYYEKHGVVPTKFEDLKIQVKIARPDNSTETQAVLDTIDNISKTEFHNMNVQEEALKFCRFRAVANAYNKHQNYIMSHQVNEEQYDAFMEDLNKAMNSAEVIHPVSIFQAPETVLDETYRNPIPTGIVGIDEATGGGIAEGEVAMVIAPLGVGKTTFLTSIANHAFMSGKNVLQIFFEDSKNSVLSKHYARMSGIPLGELTENKEFVLNKVKEIESEATGHIEILKFPADGVTVSKIKGLVKKQIAKGFKPDLIVIDYVDCIEAEYEKGGTVLDEWGYEGKIMRKLESLADDFQVAIWTATQGNRSSINAEIVTTDKMGGSIKKAQFAHFIMSIAKTQEQQEMNTATISIGKNRFGPAGQVFENCMFDNGLVQINTESKISMNDLIQRKNEEAAERRKAQYLSYLEQDVNINQEGQPNT